jgi:hypothetical protein
MKGKISSTGSMTLKSSSYIIHNHVQIRFLGDLIFAKDQNVALTHDNKFIPFLYTPGNLEISCDDHGGIIELENLYIICAGKFSINSHNVSFKHIHVSVARMHIGAFEKHGWFAVLDYNSQMSEHYKNSIMNAIILSGIEQDLEKNITRTIILPSIEEDNIHEQDTLSIMGSLRCETGP